MGSGGSVKVCSHQQPCTLPQPSMPVNASGPMGLHRCAHSRWVRLGRYGPSVTTRSKTGLRGSLTFTLRAGHTRGRNNGSRLFCPREEPSVSEILMAVCLVG